MRIRTPHLNAELTCGTSEEYASALQELQTLLDFIEEGFASVIFNIPKLQLVASEGESLQNDISVEYRGFLVKYDAQTKDLELVKGLPSEDIEEHP